jgi:hypothetical protein
MTPTSYPKIKLEAHEDYLYQILLLEKLPGEKIKLEAHED